MCTRPSLFPRDHQQLCVEKRDGFAKVLSSANASSDEAMKCIMRWNSGVVELLREHSGIQDDAMDRIKGEFDRLSRSVCGKLSRLHKLT